MSKEKITHHQKLNRDEIAGYFQDLDSSFQAGKIAIEKILVNTNI
jgi:hypothetical protein